MRSGQQTLKQKRAERALGSIASYTEKPVIRDKPMESARFGQLSCVLFRAEE
jgi:hypothetical protein